MELLLKFTISEVLMSISSINNQSTSIEQVKPSYNASDLKKENNQKIVQAQLDVSLKDGPNVMSLLFRTALEEINKQLGASNNPENHIQKAYDNELDISPEATAKRIFTGATAFFNAYKEQNSELSESEALTQFMEVIRSGIDTGFGEARNILESLSVLEGEIASNIDLTYDFVKVGLDEFNQKITEQLEEDIPSTNTN